MLSFYFCALVLSFMLSFTLTAPEIKQFFFLRRGRCWRWRHLAWRVPAAGLELDLT